MTRTWPPARLMHPLNSIVRSTTAALAGLLVVSCAQMDPLPAWNTNQMMRELTAELRQFEGVTTEFVESEVLAWRIQGRGDRERVEIALVWGRDASASGGTRGWALAQGWRHPEIDAVWRRSLFNRTLSAALTHLRPGETADGTWHAYQRYDHAPTSREICDFAAVDFFNDEARAGYRRLAGSLRRGAWLRVAGEAPGCGFAGSR